MTDQEELQEALIAWLRARAAEAGSQKELCAQTGINVGTLQNWLRGMREPGFFPVARIALEMGASLDTILWPERPSRSSGVPGVLEMVMEGLEEYFESHGITSIRPDVYRKLCLIVAKRVQDRISAAKENGNIININEFSDVIDLAVSR